MRGGLTDAGAVPAASTNFLSYLVQYCPNNACFIVFFDNCQSDVVQPDLLKSDGIFDGISWDSQPDTVMALTDLTGVFQSSSILPIATISLASSR